MGLASALPAGRGGGQLRCPRAARKGLPSLPMGCAAPGPPSAGSPQEAGVRAGRPADQCGGLPLGLFCCHLFSTFTLRSVRLL